MASGAGGGSNDAAIRGELVEKDGRPTLVAIRRLRWGTAILSERPVMYVESDPDTYLRAVDSDVRLGELAEALGDPHRLATYVAFKQLHDRKQKEILAFWREDIMQTDPLARGIHMQNRRGVEEFVKDRPEFSNLVYWEHFIAAASIFCRFGIVNQDGSRAVYGLCSHVRHSCSPNSAWFTLKHGFPKGRKMLHVIGTNGIARGEEITVSHHPESLLLLPKAQRAAKMFLGASFSCECPRCRDDEDGTADEKIKAALHGLQVAMGIVPPTDNSTKAAQLHLKELDKLLLFSMVVKAKTKVLLAQAMRELTQRAAWQEKSKGANIIVWSGLDAVTQEQRLKDTKKLYETAAKDFEYLLGQDAGAILERMEVGYRPVADQHKMLAKYTKDREKEADEMLRKQRDGAYRSGPVDPAVNDLMWGRIHRGSAAKNAADAGKR